VRIAAALEAREEEATGQKGADPLPAVVGDDVQAHLDALSVDERGEGGADDRPFVLDGEADSPPTEVLGRLVGREVDEVILSPDPRGEGGVHLFHAIGELRPLAKLAEMRGG
jgi:hypothetical protein